MPVQGVHNLNAMMSTFRYQISTVCLVTLHVKLEYDSCFRGYVAYRIESGLFLWRYSALLDKTTDLNRAKTPADIIKLRQVLYSLLLKSLT